MINHPNRNKNVLLLNQGCAIARAILADGSLTLIGNPAHDGGVIARQHAALVAVEAAMHIYNSEDRDQTIPAYADADNLRHTLREGVQSMATRIKAI